MDTTIPEDYWKTIAPLIAAAKGILEKGEPLAPIAFVGSFATSACISVLLESSSADAKDRSAMAVAAAASKVEADFIFVMMEAWSLRKDKMSQMDAILRKYGSIGASPYAVDVVSMSLETRYGVWMAEAPIKPQGHLQKETHHRHPGIPSFQ